MYQDNEMVSPLKINRFVICRKNEVDSFIKLKEMPWLHTYAFKILINSGIMCPASVVSVINT